MKTKSVFSFSFAISLMSVSVIQAGEPSSITPNFADAHEKPPPGWEGPVFELSQNYPDSMSKIATFPWADIKFRTSPKAYMETVLKYVYEGNIEVNWTIQNNPIRKWYHAPWMHWGRSGREFIHGLTMERFSRPGELAPTQVDTFQNWAVGFYNSFGGYTIGQVWKNPSEPDASQAIFPIGTVTAKLLFTEAPVNQVPYLEGTVEWEANILTKLNSSRRRPRTVRLLQVDIAVRDSMADSTTGWVFGTFVYQNGSSGSTAWDRLVPVGLMWGNDPEITPGMVASGTKLRETWLNPDLKLQHYGWAGRLNGPVDNPLSSCLSCHSTAQVPSKSRMAPFERYPDSTKLRWFRNLKAGEPFDSGSISTDYSLQLSLGIRNYLRALNRSRTSRQFIRGDSTDAGSEMPFEINGQMYYPINR